MESNNGSQFLPSSLGITNLVTHTEYFKAIATVSGSFDLGDILRRTVVKDAQANTFISEQWENLTDLTIFNTAPSSTTVSPIDGSSSGAVLPAGAATEAAQLDANTTLSSINTRLLGKATEAKQDVGNTHLSGIKGNLDATNISLTSIDGKLDGKATEATQLAVLAALSPPVSTPTATGLAGSHPTVDAFLQVVFMDPDGQGGTFNSLPVPDGFNWSVPVRIAANTVNLTSSGTGQWIIIETP